LKYVVRFIFFLFLAKTAIVQSFAGGEPYSLHEQVEVLGFYTNCSSQSGCAIHLEASVEGVKARSIALPFRSDSGETERSSSGEWFIGIEEASIKVSVEAAGDGAILVRQEAGFDHPKVAYALIVPGSSNLHTIKSWETRNGPEALSVQSVDGLISIERRQGNLINSTEKWRIDSNRRNLVPTQ